MSEEIEINKELVSITMERLLMAAWNTNNVSCPSEIPRASIDDGLMYEVFGEEHNWDNVICLFLDFYRRHGKTLNIPDLEHLKEHYSEWAESKKEGGE